MGEYLRLQSSQPITDCGRKYNIWYWICAIVGGIVLFFMGSLPGTILGIILGLIVGLCIKNLILNFECTKLRHVKFALDRKLPYADLFIKLNQTLTPIGMHIEARSDGSPSITYNGMIYDVSYGSTENCFTIWWRLNLARAFLSSNYYIGIYRKASVAMGIIGYYVQQACNGNSSHQNINEDNNNEDNNSMNADVKFCPKCGNKYKVGTRFCTKCGNGLE